jgi:hypothetical protein
MRVSPDAPAGLAAARAAASAAVRATTTPAGAMTEAPTSIRRAAASAARW